MRIFILFLTLACFITCKHKPQSDNIFFVDLDHPEKASLFDYFRSVEIIPLENSPDALVAGISKIVIHQDKYYLLDMRQSIVFIFNHSGKYLSKIDKKGQGPGEYRFIQDIHINLFSGNIELLEPTGLVHSFNLSGDYIESKRIEFPEFRAAHQIAAIESNLHVFYAQFEPQKIFYYNFDEKKLLHEEFEESRDIGKFGGRNLFSFKDEWYFFRPFHPCVYKLGKEKLEAVFRFDFGKYTREGTKLSLSQEAKNNRQRAGEEVFAQYPYWIRILRFNSKYIFVQLPWGNIDDNKSFIVYDKSINKGKFIRQFKENVEFEPYIVTDEYVLNICNWEDLKKYITKEMLDDSQKEIFDKLLQSEMELNPIMIKYRFK